MDKKLITRIPSIFDSDDDEEDSSQSGSLLREHNAPPEGDLEQKSSSGARVQSGDEACLEVTQDEASVGGSKDDVDEEKINEGISAEEKTCDGKSIEDISTEDKIFKPDESDQSSTTLDKESDAGNDIEMNDEHVNTDDDMVSEDGGDVVDEKEDFSKGEENKDVVVEERTLGKDEEKVQTDNDDGTDSDELGMEGDDVNDEDDVDNNEDDVDNNEDDVDNNEDDVDNDEDDMDNEEVDSSNNVEGSEVNDQDISEDDDKEEISNGEGEDEYIEKNVKDNLNDSEVDTEMNELDEMEDDVNEVEDNKINEEEDNDDEVNEGDERNEDDLEVDVDDRVDESPMEEDEEDVADVADAMEDNETNDSLDVANTYQENEEVESASVTEGIDKDTGESKDDDFVDDEGSNGYVIDLNESDDETDPKASKLEDREALDSSISSSSSSSPSSLVIEDELNGEKVEKGNEKDDEEVDTKTSGNSEEPDASSSKLSLLADSAEKVQKELTAEKKVYQVPEAPKRKIPIIRVPVKVQDVYTDSEDETANEEKATGTSTSQKNDEDKDVDLTSETTVSADPEDLKEVASSSSRPASADPEASSSVSTTQSESVTATPRIWVSSSLFDRKMSKEKEESPSSKINTPKRSEETPTSEKKRRSRAIHGVFNKEKCLYALDQGWKREMVYRAVTDPCQTGKVRADIYYYTPEGKKLRSKVEIEDFLLRKAVTDLSVDNFSFAKEPIGAKEGQEIIRHASSKSSPCSILRRKLDMPDQAEQNVTKTPKLKKQRGRPRIHPIEGGEPPSKKIKTSAVVTPPQVKQPVAKDASKSTTFKKIMLKVTPDVPTKNVGKVNPGPSRSVKSISEQPALSISGMNQKSIFVTKPEASIPAARRKFAVKNHVVFATKLCEFDGLSTRILSPMLSERARQQTYHCTGLCEHGNGTVPSLQCIKCLCLFHGKCTKVPTPVVELIQSGNAKFLCPNCYKENKENVSNSKFTPPTPYEPLAQDPTSSSESEDSDVEVLEPSEYPAGYVRVHHDHLSPLATPPMSPVGSSSGFVEEQKHREESAQVNTTDCTQNTTDCVESGISTGTTIPSDGQSHFRTTPVDVAAPTTSMANNSAIMGVTPGGQILRIQAPGATGTRFLLVRPQQQNTTVQTCTQVGPMKAVYLPAVGQVPILLPNTVSSNTSSGPQYVNGGSAQSSSQLYVSSGLQHYSQPVCTPVPQPSTVPEKPKTPPPAPKLKASVVQKKDFLQEISLGYRLLLRVFKYLTAKDLLVTSRVCLMWRDLSYSSALWTTLRLRNICVRNWDLLAIFLERRNTKNIDLRKMIFRVRQCSPEPEDHSRLSSSESDSPASGHPLDLTPSLANNSKLAERLPSPDKGKKTDELGSESAPRTSDKDRTTECNVGGDTKELPSSLEEDISKSNSVREQSLSPSKETPKSPTKDSSRRPSRETTSLSPSQKKCTSPVKESYETSTKEAVEGPSVDSPVTTFKKITLSPRKDSKSPSRELSASPSKESSCLPTRTHKSSDDSKEGEEPCDNGKSNLALVNQSKKDHDKESCQDTDKQFVKTIEDSSSEEEPMEIDDSAQMDIVDDDVGIKKEQHLEETEEVEKQPESFEGDTKTLNVATECERKSHMKSRRGSRALSVPSSEKDRFIDTKNKEINTWRHICEALGTVRCLRTVVLPPCLPEVVHLLLSNCKNITSVTAADIWSKSTVQFDPAYLMEASKLKEVRLGSVQGLSFTTNFNFIKLQDLKILVIKGFSGNCWPYLGTNLTSLHLGPCQSFTHRTWANIGSMTNLRALWLEDGGCVHDIQIVEALSHLSQLRRLCLFNFTVGVKLGFALKKLTKLERVFVLQDSSDEETMGMKNHNMLAVTEHLRFVDELVWAVSSQDVKSICNVDHMHIRSPKVKSYPSLSTKENASDQWPLKLIETVIKRHLPMTNVRIMKLDPAAAARMALSSL